MTLALHQDRPAFFAQLEVDAAIRIDGKTGRLSS
jgi:hypothetical protein